MESIWNLEWVDEGKDVVVKERWIDAKSNSTIPVQSNMSTDTDWKMYHSTE